MKIPTLQKSGPYAPRKWVIREGSKRGWTNLKVPTDSTNQPVLDALRATPTSAAYFAADGALVARQWCLPPGSV